MDATLNTELLSAKRVRVMLDISDRMLRRWLSRGRFPKPDIRLGRSMRWRRSTIERFIDEHATP